MYIIPCPFTAAGKNIVLSYTILQRWFAGKFYFCVTKLDFKTSSLCPYYIMHTMVGYVKIRILHGKKCNEDRRFSYPAIIILNVGIRNVYIYISLNCYQGMIIAVFQGVFDAFDGNIEFQPEINFDNVPVICVLGTYKKKKT